MKRDKRGISNHVEMILASVLFITFFFFVIMFLQPYKTDSLTVSVVDGVYYVLEDFVKIDVREIFLTVNESFGECFSIPIELNGLVNGTVRDIYGNSIRSSLESSVMNIDSGAGSYYLFFSKQFNASNFNEECPILTSDNYDIGGSYDMNVVYFPLLEKLKDDYNNDYESLKERLGIPNKFDFAITSDIVEMTRDVPDGVSVVAKSYVEDVMYNDSSMENKVFIIKIW